MTISVIVADDQPMISVALTMLLAAEPDFVVLGEARDGREAIALTETLRPDVVLMDVRMPGMDGITATRALCRGEPAEPEGGGGAAKVIVLTSFDDDQILFEAFQAGARGFLLKHSNPRDLITAVRQVAAGGAWLDPAITSKVIAALARGFTPGASSSRLAARLTPREREVLVLMAHGLSNHEIMERLVLSEATVKTHVARVVAKTGSRDRTQAVVFAYQSGLMSTPLSRDSQ